MKVRMLAVVVLIGSCSAPAWAQVSEQYVEITTLPQATTTYRVATAPAPAVPLTYGYAPPPVAYSAPVTNYGAPVTTYRAPGVVQAGYAPTVTYSPVTTVPLQPVPGGYSTVAPISPAYGTQAPPYRPIVALSSAPTNGIVGQGIIGQPKLYMPSQPVRNFLRWLTP